MEKCNCGNAGQGNDLSSKTDKERGVHIFTWTCTICGEKNSKEIIYKQRL